MNSLVVARQRARLGEGDITNLAGEGPHIQVAPVVHNQARALLEHLITFPVLALKARLGAPGNVVH